MHNKILCTVEILTHNSAETLRRALESVKDFAEVLIVDGGSTDDTLAIAREYGAKIILQDSAFLDGEGRIADFSGVRNQGLDAAEEPWFFFLDSDEEASRALVEKIRTAVSRNAPAAYWVTRLYTYKGTTVTCATSYPNRQMRFFHRDAVKTFRKPIHERVVVAEGATVLDIAEPILVPVLEDEVALEEKARAYARAEIERLAALGRPALWRGALGGCRGMASWALRFMRGLIFCRGTRLPFSHEFRSFRYQARLAVLSARRLFML